MRIVFYGTPEFAVASLEALVNSDHEVIAVVTAPDRLGGRGGKQVLTSAVKRFAERRQLPVYQPKNLKAEAFAKTLDALAADVQVVVAFRMLPERVWAHPPLGTFNVHGSLLPAYRGAAPIHWAVINGETETGVSVFRLQHAIDTGRLLLQARTPIGRDETTGDVYERLKDIGAAALLEALDLIAFGRADGIPQDDARATHAPKLTRENTNVDWRLPAVRIHDFVRGLMPFPTAYTQYDGSSVQLLRSSLPVPSLLEADASPTPTPGSFRLVKPEPMVQGGAPALAVMTGDGREVFVHELKPAGKRAMSAQDFWNGLRPEAPRAFA